jgi:hypothetical protein
MTTEHKHSWWCQTCEMTMAEAYGSALEPSLDVIRQAIRDWWNDSVRKDHSIGISLADYEYRALIFDELASLIAARLVPSDREAER